MKKQIVTTALASIVAFSGMTAAGIDQPQVQAAAVTQNNQAAVEAKANQLISTAKGLMGKATYSTAVYKKTAPYKFSCATFLNFIFEKEGVDLATYNENYMMKQGTAVSKANLQKGDLVFFDSNRNDSEPADHVGMYIGDNKIIHMADSKQNIVISDLDSKAYYRDNYLTARRVLPTLMSGSPATKGDKVVASAYSLMSSSQSSSLTNAGFVNRVFQNNGIQLGTTSLKEQMKKGTFVSKSQLKKGDIVFFNGTPGSKTPSLAAVYAGDHRLVMKTSEGVVSRVIFVDWYEQHYLTARRVIK
ncbi:C40 family peptidase [Domibacillus indicus]|uniref:C40 family peptidase n=1 Tax=Domibacillus indicus TaxID=1437523 RepID=UPI00069649E1|nr:NlpC/P60 family protein [Domibacillus indicus]